MTGPKVSQQDIAVLQTHYIIFTSPIFLLLIARLIMYNFYLSPRFSISFLHCNAEQLFLSTSLKSSYYYSVLLAVQCCDPDGATHTTSTQKPIDVGRASQWWLEIAKKRSSTKSKLAVGSDRPIKSQKEAQQSAALILITCWLRAVVCDLVRRHTACPAASASPQ